MRPSFRLRIDNADAKHVHFTIFSGPLGGTRANCGSLCMDEAEFNLFRTALTVGAHRMGTVEVESDMVKMAGPEEQAAHIQEHADFVRENQQDR